jgi:outer membrane protein W
LNFKHFFFTALCSINSFSQTDSNNDSLDRNKVEVHIDASYIAPVPLGDNFAKNGLNFEYGLNISINYYLKNNIFIGTGFQHLKADVVDANLLGFYNDTQLNSWVLSAGYKFYLNNNLRFEPYLGLGLTSYNNKRSDQTISIINFRDTAGSIIFSPSFKYILNKRFMVFLKPEYRIDNMNIRVAPEIENVFKRATYLNFLIGMSLTFY